MFWVRSDLTDSDGRLDLISSNCFFMFKFVFGFICHQWIGSYADDPLIVSESQPMRFLLFTDKIAFTYQL